MSDTLNNYDLLDEIKKTSILSGDAFDLWRVDKDYAVQPGEVCGSGGDLVDYDYTIEVGWYLIDTSAAVEIVDSIDGLADYGDDLVVAARAIK